MRTATPNLLNTSKSRCLPFDITGTSDVMFVETVSKTSPSFGVRILMELTKKEPGEKSEIQAMGQLLAADQHSRWTPTVILSDLNDTWKFMWLEGLTLCFSLAPSRSARHSQRRSAY